LNLGCGIGDIRIDVWKPPSVHPNFTLCHEYTSSNISGYGSGVHILFIWHNKLFTNIRHVKKWPEVFDTEVT